MHYVARARVACQPVLQFLSRLLTQGAVLVLAAWVLQREDVVREAAGPYAGFFCFGALSAAVLVSWYYDQSRLLGIAAAVTLSAWKLGTLPVDPDVATLAAFLLPVNFVLFAALKERGVLSIDGFLKVALIAAQVAGVAWFADHHIVADFLRVGDRAGLWLPLASEVSFVAAAIAMVALVFVRRTKVEQGLLWALASVFLGLYEIERPQALLFYFGAAGLVLVLAVLEHGYEIAYRDELTGLPGRRAFTNAIGHLGGTYAIAMCDVDHFKRFNDTYGHDVGDQLLKAVAARLSEVGGGGRAFRYGGEEFLVVFRGCTAEEAAPYAEALRQAIADTRLDARTSDRSSIGVSVSIGISEKSKRHSTPELVVEAADKALYRAKEAGRNCVKLEEGAGLPAEQIAARI
jgi:diguanylate cyclase (GGDEF)-like protein